MGKFEEPAGDEVRLLLRNLSRAPFRDSSAGVRLYGERIPDVGSAPLEVLPVTLDTCVPVKDDQAQVTITEFARMDAYRVVIGFCDATQEPDSARP
jgi:hypothetical protein